MHPYLAAALNPLRTPQDQRRSWDAYEQLRERSLMGELGLGWYVCVKGGRIRLGDVPHEHRDFVYNKLCHDRIAELDASRPFDGG